MDEASCFRVGCWLLLGLQLYFDSVNKNGGIHGNTMKLLRQDDGGRPEDTLALARKVLAQPEVLALTGVIGGRNVTELVSSGTLRNAGVPLVGYRSAESPPESPLVYNVRASLDDEVAKIVQHVTTIGMQRLGVFYEDGPAANTLLRSADQIARKSGATIAVAAGYEPGTARVTPAVDAFMKAAPQAILMVSSGAAAAGFIEQYRASGGAAQLLATSGADIEQLSKRLSEDQMQGVAIAQVTPSPYKIGNRLVKEFTDIVAKTPDLEVPVSYSMMEGFIAAKVISQAVRSQGKSPSRKGMIAALDGMSHFDLGGHMISFSPASRSGSSRVELSIISAAGRIRQ